MRDLLRLLCLVAALAVPAAAQTPAEEPPAQAPAVQTPFAPVAVVNGDPITGFDVEQRMRLLQVIAGSQADPATLQRVALDQLIEDRLKLQEGKRRGIEPTEELLAAGAERFARSRDTTVEALLQRLQQNGISALALKDLIASEVVWLELVRGRFLNDVEPAPAEIDAEIGLIGQTSPGTAYRLQEIGLPVAEGRAEETRTLADQIYAQLAAGGDFTQAVQQYSRAPSAAKGGELGWVDANRLPPELAATLAGLQPGQVSPPIPVGAGFSIVKLLEVRRDQAPDPGQVAPEVRQQVRDRMIEQRMARLAEGLLQELRRDALIESR